MDHFVSRYRAALLALGVLWNGFLLWYGTGGFIPGAYIFSIGIAPIVALAGLARFVGSRIVLLLAAGVHVALTANAAYYLFWGESSTDAVGLVVAPIASLVVVVPAAALAGFVIARVTRRTVGKPKLVARGR